MTDPDVLPLPSWLRATIADAGWYVEQCGIKKQYAAIGGRTNMRALSQEQADLVAQLLRARGYDARPYVGFTMTTPWIESALDEAKRENIDKLFVLYQGAQYSNDTAQIVFRHVQTYLKKYPDWKVKVVGIRSFSDDRRFVDLIAKRLEQRLASDFSTYEPEDVCIFLTSHDNVLRLAHEGDPYLEQVSRVISSLKDRFSNYDVSYGYHNHDEIPVVQWSQPNNEKSLKAVAKKSCQAVLINGQISFSIDNLETLYNQVIEAPAVLQAETCRLRIPPKKVVVENIFNSDMDFATLMADIVEEADRGAGDLILLRE